MTLWVVRAGEKGEQEDGALANNLVTIGWNEFGDLSGYDDFDSLYDYYKSIHTKEKHDKPTDYEKSTRLLCGEVWSFLRKIKIGDLVVLPSKKSDDIFIGKIIGSYEYETYAENIKHVRKVQWLKTIKRSELPPFILSSFNTGLTVFEVKENDAEAIIQKMIGSKNKSDKFEEGEILVKEFLEKEYGELFVNFQHKALVEEENYKLQIYQSARKELNLSNWNEWIKTPGKILDAVKKATEVDPKNNNLLDITGKRGQQNNSNACLYQIKDVPGFEKVLYDFFLGGPSNPKSLGPRFDNLSKFISENNGKSDWRFLSYLLFLFNSDLYFPIGPQKFDKALNFYEIPQKLSYEEKTWEKYTLILDLVYDVGSKLSKKYGPVSNLQVQSYLWELIRALESKSERKRALYVTNNYPWMFEEFQEIVKNKGKAYYAIGNWNPAAISLSEYPLHMYLQSKGNVVAVFTVSKILNSEEFDKIENKMSYRITQKTDDWDLPTSAFLELIEINILTNPFPINYLEQFDSKKKVDYHPQRIGYVVDIGIPEIKNQQQTERPLQSPRNYFLANGPWSNWEWSLNKNPILWGMTDDPLAKKGVFDKIKKDDIVFLKVDSKNPHPFKDSGIFGVGRIIKKCENQKEPFWPDEIKNGKASWINRFQIQILKKIQPHEDVIWFKKTSGEKGLPTTKGMNNIRFDNPFFEPLLDEVKKRWNIDLETEFEPKYFLREIKSKFHTIRNEEINKIFNVNYMRGILYNDRNDFVVIVKSLAGIYDDEIGTEIIQYTGEGSKERGDQKLTAGNLAIIEAKNQGKRVYFLHEVEKPGGGRTNDYEFLGEVEYTGHYFEEIPSENRKVIRFLLKRVKGPWDLKPLTANSEKHIESISWQPGSDFNTSTQTIQLPKSIREQYSISESDFIQIKLENIPITNSFTSGYEIIIPENIRKYVQTKKEYSCSIERINPILLRNFTEYDFVHFTKNNLESDSKLISFQKINNEFYFYAVGTIGNFEHDPCTSSLRSLMLPITSKIYPFCTEPTLTIEEIDLKNHLQKIILDAKYGLSGQKPLVLISILYWLSKTKFGENSLVEYLKNLKLNTENELELLVNNSTLFSDYLLVYRLYQSLGLMRFEIDRVNYHIKHVLEMNTNTDRLISDFSQNNLDTLLSNLSPERTKIILYKILKENLEEKKFINFWSSLFGSYYAIKCPKEIHEEIINMTNYDPNSTVIQINPEIYNKIMSQISNIYETKPVSDKLKIPSNKELEEGINAIKQELLIDENIIREIVTHLCSGRHILLAGPVGTGKTRLSQILPQTFWTEHCGYFSDVVTATADWSTHEVIGGLIPKENPRDNSVPKYEIEDGCVTKTIKANYNLNLQRHTSFNQSNGISKEYYGTWLVIDEFNRADIDKAFGPLFTALEYKILKIPTTESKKSEKEIRIPSDYRIIGTLNTVDKHFLFNLSDALKRRFAYVEIPIPSSDKKEEEIFLTSQNALNSLLKDLSENEKLTDIMDIKGKKIVYKKEDLEKKFITAYDVLELIRSFKPLGTAILKSIFQTLIISEKMNIDNALDMALNANLIPQIEDLDNSHLELLSKIITDDNFMDYLSKIDSTEKYKASFESVLRYLGYNQKNIQDMSEKFLNQDFEAIKPDLSQKYSNKKDKSSLKSIQDTRFVKSLHELINQSEII